MPTYLLPTAHIAFRLDPPTTTRIRDSGLVLLPGAGPATSVCAPATQLIGGCMHKGSGWLWEGKPIHCFCGCTHCPADRWVHKQRMLAGFPSQSWPLSLMMVAAGPGMEVMEAVGRGRHVSGQTWKTNQELQYNLYYRQMFVAFSDM